MTRHENSSFLLVKNLQYFASQVNFTKKMIESQIKQASLKEKNLKQIEKTQKLIKSLKKQVKDMKLSDIEVIQIYGSTLNYIEQRIRQIVYSVKIQKTDFQFYMMKRQVKQNQNTCGITKNIDTQKYDDRVLLQTNLAQVIDIEYHRFSLKSLHLKASEILKNFKYHQVTFLNQTEIDPLLHQLIQNYNVVPYHNFTHAFSVFSMFYYFSKSSKLQQWINDFQLYFCLVACLGHDLRHNGYNSVFETKTKSEMAMNFGNISILQKMHKNVVFSIIQSLKQKSPFQVLSTQEIKQAKKIITSCILATDMSKHYDYISNLKERKLKCQKSQDKILIMESLIHACDIGNSMLDYENYITWANLVCVEFHEQTIQQKINGLQVTNHMKFESLNYFYKNQNTFINTVVYPMWQCLDLQINEEKIKQKLKIIKQNGKKISEQMRRNSDCDLKTNLSKYLNKLLRQIHL